jgi:hypothetical protein
MPTKLQFEEILAGMEAEKKLKVPIINTPNSVSTEIENLIEDFNFESIHDNDSGENVREDFEGK